MKTQKQAIQKVGFSFPVQVLKYSEEDGDFHIVGYAATTDFDLQGDIITEGALKASAQDLLKNSTVLLNHDPKLPIGKVTKVEFNNNGLLIDALISKTEQEIIQKIKEGILNKFSIRGQVIDRERSFSAEYNRMVNVINRMSLIEVSLVSVPANPEAKAIGWYISKALEEPAVEGVKQMPETPDKDKILPERPQESAHATEEPTQKAATPTADAPKVEPSVAPPKPAKEQDAFMQVQAEKPGEIHKDTTSIVKTQLEPVFPLLEKLIGMGGQPAIVSQQILTILKKLVGEPVPASAAPGISKDEMQKMIVGEVQRIIEPHLKAIPAIRKGLVSQENEADEIRKKFDSLSPEQKLRAALAFQEKK